MSTKNNDSMHSDDHAEEKTQPETKVKPHILRRNVEDYLEQRKLQRRLKDVFDDDFLTD